MSWSKAWVRLFILPLVGIGLSGFSLAPGYLEKTEKSSSIVKVARAVPGNPSRVTPTVKYYLFTLTMDGQGEVALDPTGHSCTSTCSLSILQKTSMSLKVKVPTGQVFDGWSGACSGTATTCTFSMTKATKVTARFKAQPAPTTPTTPTTPSTPSTGSGVNLAVGLLSDKLNHAMPSVAKPDVGVAFTDPVFKTTIRRLTNAGTGNTIKTAYSTMPAWNADESLMILYHTGSSVKGGAGHHLYNGKTYAYIKKLDIDPPDLEQFYWDTKDPDILYFIDESNQLVKYHVSTAKQDVIKKFTCADRVSGGSDPMFTSFDSDLFGLQCDGNLFSYRISTNQESARVRDTTGSGLAPIASPSGKFMFFGSAPAAKVYDTNMKLLRTLDMSGDTHADLGILADGTDYFGGVQFDDVFTGTLIVADLSGKTKTREIIGENTGFPYPPSGTHVSATAIKNPGWVAVSVVGNTSGKTVLNQELLLVNLNPNGGIYRVAHHHSFGKEGKMGYWAEPHPVLSPSGTRIAFSSDWNNSGSVDVYVVELPAYTSK